MDWIDPGNARRWSSRFPPGNSHPPITRDICSNHGLVRWPSSDEPGDCKCGHHARAIRPCLATLLRQRRCDPILLYYLSDHDWHFDRPQATDALTHWARIPCPWWQLGCSASFRDKPGKVPCDEL